MKKIAVTGLTLLTAVALSACPTDSKPLSQGASAGSTADDDNSAPAENPGPSAAASQPASSASQPATAAGQPATGGALLADQGVDVDAKKIRIGALNDESGPAAAIGKPYAWGKRILAAEVNAGGSGILPDGWTIELVEKDHGYNPGKSQQSYEAIKDEILFLATSFGTPPTMPLRPFLERDKVVAFPASLSSQMSEHAFTPPAGPGYKFEALRAVDWAIESAGGADKVKFGIIYDQTDYGADGHMGLTMAAKAMGVAVVAERAIKPGQKDFTADITALKKAGATHVLLTILPSSTGVVLGTAAKMQFGPVWIGNTPSWIDAFFAHPKLPPVVFANFHWVTGMPFWGEDVPGMDKFLAAYDKHGKGNVNPDFYVLMSYLQGRLALEAAKRAIEAGDITRAGYLKALQGIKAFDAGGLLQPLNFSEFPYVTGTRTRILKPNFEKTTWTEVAPYKGSGA